MHKVRTPWPVATRAQYIVAFQDKDGHHALQQPQDCHGAEDAVPCHSSEESGLSLRRRMTTIPAKTSIPTRKKPPNRPTSAPPGLETVSMALNPPLQQIFQPDELPADPQIHEAARYRPLCRRHARCLCTTVASVILDDTTGYELYLLFMGQVWRFYLSDQPYQP